MKKHLLTLSLAVAGFSANAQIWQAVSSNFPDTTIGIRRLDVVDANTVWAVGYDGTYTTRNYIGFTRTTDGVNYTAGTFLPDTNDYQISNISAVNDTVAFICAYSKNATLQGIVRKTTDGGATWTDIQSTGMFTGAANFPNVVHFYDEMNGWTMGDPNNTAGSGNEYEIWHTTDGGATWTRVPGANIPNPASGEYGLTDVYTTFGTQNIWFGTNNGKVFRSTDGGQTWLNASVGGMAGGVNGLAFTDANNGLVWGLSAATGGTFVLKRTSNGGATWTTITTAGTNNIGRNDICVIPGQNGYMSVGIDVLQSQYVTSTSFDNGVTWNIVESGLTNSERLIIVEAVDSVTAWGGNFSDNTVGAPFGGMMKYAGQPLVIGLKPVDKVSDDMVYPNPNNGQFSIRLGKLLANTTIQVIDVLGKVVYSNTITSNSGLNQEIKMDLSNQAKGIYSVVVTNASGSQVQKISVQ